MNNNTKAGLEILQWSKEYNSLVPVIMMSGHGNIETAMIAAKTGAFDFIEKPFKSERLLLLVEKALNDRNLKIKISDFEAKENGYYSYTVDFTKGEGEVFVDVDRQLLIDFIIYPLGALCLVFGLYKRKDEKMGESVDAVLEDID